MPASITVVDNASTDDTLSICKDFPQVTVLPQPTNRGFAGGHNIGMAHGHADYVLVVNPDVALDVHYLEQLVAFAEATPNVGAFVGIVHRPNGTVDTTGLHVARSRVVRDRTTVSTQPEKIFGVSGAVALYRRQALHAVAVAGHFFDEQFFAYKEDVQLAWRLQWAGWEAYCVPTAHAVHGRAVGAGMPRSTRNTERRYLSYRNHLLLYPSVERLATWLPDVWCIAPAETLRLFYLLVTDARVTLRALAAVGKMWHAARTFATQQRRSSPSARIRSAMHT